MKQFLALFQARTKEFYRDRSSLSWTFIFPILIIIGCAIAFSQDQQELFSIGVYQSGNQSNNQPSTPEIALLNAPYNKVILYQDLNQALERIRHHQLHLLINTEAPYKYWINPKSSQGQVLEQLLIHQAPEPFHREEVIGQQIRYVDWVIPGILGMNMMFGSLFGVGFVIVRYRNNGVLKRLQATPLNAFQFLSAQVASRILIVLIACTLIFTGAKFSLNLVMLGSYLDLFIVGIMGGLSMIALGLLMSSRTDSEEFANGMLNAATWPMMFLSGVWFSLDDTPIYMQKAAQFLPLTHIVNAAREIMINGAELTAVSFNLWALAAMTALFLTLSSLLFRWHR